MLTRINKAREDREAGFTLIELLVVVAIIAILAVIAIPIFNSLRDSAASTAAESDIRNAVTTIEVGYTQEGSFPLTADVDANGVPGYDDGTGTIVPLEISLAPDTGVQYTSDGASFTLTGCSVGVPDGNATVYTWDSDTGSFSTITENTNCTLTAGWN